MRTAPFKKRLEEEKLRLESQMGEIGRRNPAVPNDWEPAPLEEGSEPDPIDQADVIVNRDTTRAIFDQLEARYDAVLRALERVAQRKYGKCSMCGGAIEEARLNADPTATTCIEHKST